MSFQQLKAKAFEEKDVEQFTSLLNLMHSKISNLDGKEAFEYFKLMQWAQQSMLPKIKQHIVGEVKLHENIEPEKKETKKSKAKK